MLADRHEATFEHRDGDAGAAMRVDHAVDVPRTVADEGVAADRRLIAELRRDVAGPQIARLEGVKIGIDELAAVVDRRLPPLVTAAVIPRSIDKDP